MNEEIEVAKERHPIRFIIRLAILAGLFYVAARFLAEMKEEYAGLTESQARDLFNEKVAPKVGDETAAEIADQVIPKLIEKGLIKPDPATDESDGAADDIDEVAEAVDTVVND